MLSLFIWIVYPHCSSIFYNQCVRSVNFIFLSLAALPQRVCMQLLFKHQTQILRQMVLIIVEIVLLYQTYTVLNNFLHPKAHGCWIQWLQCRWQIKDRLLIYWIACKANKYCIIYWLIVFPVSALHMASDTRPFHWHSAVDLHLTGCMLYVLQRISCVPQQTCVEICGLILWSHTKCRRSVAQTDCRTWKWLNCNVIAGYHLAQVLISK